MFNEHIRAVVLGEAAGKSRNEAVAEQQYEDSVRMWAADLATQIVIAQQHGDVLETAQKLYAFVVGVKGGADVDAA